MFKAMVWKELREVGGIGLAALAAQIYLSIAVVHPDIFPFIRRYGMGVPFINYDYIGWLGTICMVMAVALGARQTLGESIHSTYPFLFHRPMGRRRLIGIKLFVGLAVYLVCGAVSIVAYGIWAATPGTHPSPFEWSMTSVAWVLWLGFMTLYLGTFLTGIRPGRWLGTRLFPLAAAGVLMFLPGALPSHDHMYWLQVCLLLAIDVWLISVILYVARTRDYS